jgi:hypothetical protein
MSSIAAASAAPTAPIKAPPQGGVLEGVNPVHFDAKNPIILFIVQVSFLEMLRFMLGAKLVGAALSRRTAMFNTETLVWLHDHRSLASTLSGGRSSRCAKAIC